MYLPAQSSKRFRHNALTPSTGEDVGILFYVKISGWENEVCCLKDSTGFVHWELCGCSIASCMALAVFYNLSWGKKVYVNNSPMLQTGKPLRSGRCSASKCRPLLCPWRSTPTKDVHLGWRWPDSDHPGSAGWLHGCHPSHLPTYPCCPSLWWSDRQGSHPPVVPDQTVFSLKLCKRT